MNIDNIIKNNSNFFHNLIQSLVEPLNFHPNDYWFEAIDASGFSKVFNNGEDLETYITKPKEYSYVIKHINNDFYVISASYHKTLEDLDNNILFDYRVISNTYFNLKKTILPEKGLSKRFPVKDYVKAALEADYIIQKDDKFFLHPMHLLELSK